MRVALRLAAVILAGLAITSCNSSTASPAASVMSSSSPSARQNLCAALAATYAERGSLADAFRAVIADNLTSAQSQAAAIRARMAALPDGLPPDSPLASADVALRDTVENAAQLMSDAARVLDPPSGKLNRLKALPDGQVLLRTMDTVMSLAQPGNPVALACPGVSYVPAEVSFPPAPANAAFGLPDTDGGWSLEPRVSELGYMDRVLKSVGVDPTSVHYIRVDMTNGVAWETFDVFGGVSASPERILNALPKETFDGVAKATASRTVNGFEIVRRGDASPDEIAVTAAVRGDRAVLFVLVPTERIDAILRAMP